MFHSLLMQAIVCFAFQWTRILFFFFFFAAAPHVIAQNDISKFIFNSILVCARKFHFDELSELGNTFMSTGLSAIHFIRFYSPIWHFASHYEFSDWCFTNQWTCFADRSFSLRNIGHGLGTRQSPFVWFITVPPEFRKSSSSRLTADFKTRRVLESGCAPDSRAQRCKSKHRSNEKRKTD